MCPYYIGGDDGETKIICPFIYNGCDDDDTAVHSCCHCRPVVGGVSKTKQDRHKFNIPKLKKTTPLQVKEWAEEGTKPQVSKNRQYKPYSASVSATGLVEMVDTIDRPASSAASQGTYARSGTYAHASSNKPGERIPKAGAFAEAGVGEARAEFSVFGAHAKGPNVSVGVMASAKGFVEAMATAGLGSASANAGPIGISVGLQLDTGIKAGIDGIEAKVLGIGISLGSKMSFSIFGNGLSFQLF